MDCCTKSEEYFFSSENPIVQDSASPRKTNILKYLFQKRPINNTTFAFLFFRIGNHNLNPIYDASTNDDASKMQDQNYELKKSENPLYDTTETAPEDTDQHLGYFSICCFYQ